ncbi:TetR/AcrR family transcriptional regulator C-terminal ligand-binding domain-containing protein [Luteococcus sp.]|uniref:TetR/AcrR family transcriptional regulator n=1 Tax=Luteococcus sp. TaxID=1969402 RepID=UPI0037365BC5
MNDIGRVGTVRPGGRTSRTRAAVLAAARTILVKQGASGMRIEAIAALSGVHRSSIYRRWGDVAGIVADLADEITRGLSTPQTGSLESDLTAIAQQLRRQLDPEGARLVRSLLAWPDDGIREVLARFWSQRREAVATVLQRHERPGDPASVLRLLAGPLHHQAVIEGEPVTEETVRLAVDAACRCANGTGISPSSTARRTRSPVAPRRRPAVLRPSRRRAAPG